MTGYRRFGPDTGVPLVYLRDPWDVIDAWDPSIIEGLVYRRPLILMDRPVLLDSNCLFAKAVLQKAEKAIEAIRELSTGRVDVLGYSIGGLVAQCVVSLQPELIRRVVFASAITDLRGVAGALGDRPIARTDAAVAARLLSVLFTSSDASRDAGRAFLRRLQLEHNDWRRLEKALDLLMSRGRSYRGHRLPILSDVLSKKGRDSLIIAGAYDTVALLDKVFAWSAELPGARFIVYPDAGHGAQFQYPSLFVDHVDHFLRPGDCT
jgi:pimeloyl-ACP methyl ester carboxylesterase